MERGRKEREQEGWVDVEGKSEGLERGREEQGAKKNGTGVSGE
jgi:hypothetical protein